VGWYDGLLRYAAYYAATSFLWDFGRALGNALLMAALALPAIRAITRFRDRFQFEVHP
jgi:energy-coupling factor transport system substrate-specific component